jgi:hypothetical protein
MICCPDLIDVVVRNVAVRAVRVAEMSSVPYEVGLIQCYIFANVLTATLLLVPPSRKGIPCSTMTPLNEGVPELIKGPNELSGIFCCTNGGSEARARQQHHSASWHVESPGQPQKDLREVGH